MSTTRIVPTSGMMKNALLASGARIVAVRATTVRYAGAHTSAARPENKVHAIAPDHSADNTNDAIGPASDGRASYDPYTSSPMRLYSTAVSTNRPATAARLTMVNTPAAMRA